MQLMKSNPSPLRDLEEMSNRLSRFFGPGWFGEGERALSSRDWSPSCDIGERAGAYEIHAELPGVKREDVQVTLEKGVLTIQGEKKEEVEKKELKLHRHELFHGTFMRQFVMPEDADENRVEAKFRDGILDVTIGKAEGREKPARKIAVR